MPKNKISRWFKRASQGGQQDSQAQTPASPAPPAPPAPAPAQNQGQNTGDQPQAMKKGVYLSALVYIEGMQAPADDFAALAKKTLSDALSGDHNGLTITLKNSHVENNVEDDSSASSASSKGGFEF